VNASKIVMETERLVLRQFDLDDAGFIVRLLNEPSWIKYIGDKHVRDATDAETYLRAGPLRMYEKHGLGLYMVETKASNQAIGMCGLIKRDSLDDVDVGFALLAEFRGMQYAFEAASATVAFGLHVLKLPRLVAITLADNRASVRLLEKLGFTFERVVQLDPDDDELRLYAISAVPSVATTA
jgi:[ribosomal protein S5]-alanine N-acetyltransferase